MPVTFVNTPGAGSFVVPAGQVLISVEAWGPGGGGGSGNDDSKDDGGSGGGSGGYTRIFPSAPAGTTVNYEIGTPGVGGPSGATLGPGTDATATTVSTYSLIANGGTGGQADGGAAGAGGTASGGLTNLTGNAGEIGMKDDPGGGGASPFPNPGTTYLPGGGGSGGDSKTASNMGSAGADGAVRFQTITLGNFFNVFDGGF